jgi:hypothetical protein
MEHQQNRLAAEIVGEIDALTAAQLRRGPPELRTGRRHAARLDVVAEQCQLIDLEMGYTEVLLKQPFERPGV